MNSAMGIGDIKEEMDIFTESIFNHNETIHTTTKFKPVDLFRCDWTPELISEVRKIRKSIMRTFEHEQ